MLKEANRIKKTVKFATTPSPPSLQTNPFCSAQTNETGTNTMADVDDEDDYEGVIYLNKVLT